MIVSVEGNIGSGKTTLLSYLENIDFDKIIIYEQVDEWKNLKNKDGNNMFNLFYTQTEKYSYLFQTYVLLSRISYLLKTIKENPDKIIICERSHLTDLNVFAQSLFEMKQLNDMEFIVYKQWHSLVTEFFNIEVNKYIYVNTCPTKCLERIKKRSRDGENEIQLDYLNLLHNKHEDWLNKQESNILIIEGNIDFLQDKEEYQNVLNKIKIFIN
jgi:deoxyadenosine/deoxycytidine kinase